MKKLYIAIAVTLSVLACKKGKEFKTESGFKYVLYTESKGTKPKIGDYVTLIMTYKNENDSVLFDYKKNGGPVRFQLERIPFKGSFEDGLQYISENDSATFYVPADSLYALYYANGETPQDKTP